MDRINADLLRTFVEVAKVEHLSRAAEALQADQSTVSRKVARLEQEVGVLLFERIGRNIRLTQAGRRLVGRAERILDERRTADQQFQTEMRTALSLVMQGISDLRTELVQKQNRK